ncbi:MAG: NUDIX domain-containing protein, partial [Pseudomonadota bacterium]
PVSPVAIAMLLKSPSNALCDKTMMNVFLYGTLCWAPLCDVVGGDDCPNGVPASLPGYKAHWVDGHSFPMIVPSYGDMADGIVLRDCLPDVMERLSYYEAAYGYVLDKVTITIGATESEAYAFFPPKDFVAGAAWDLEDWAAAHGPLVVTAAAEVMARHHHDTPAELRRKYPMMQVRAAARLEAQKTPSHPSPSGLAAADIEVEKYTVPYVNFFALSEYELRMPKFAGGYSDTMHRAAFMGTDAAIVLPYDPRRDCVLLVEQFRMGPFCRGDSHPWMMEPIAGRVDVGETAANAAQREAMEEAKLTLNDLHLVHSGYASPGCSTEYFNIYVGLTDLPDSAATDGGLATESEDIKGHIMHWDDFYDALSGGQLPVTPLALAGYWLALNRMIFRQSA